VPTNRATEFHLVHRARRVSELSVAWTVTASAAAIGLGLASNSAALVAFGAIGLVDAVGSIALVHHFRHGLRHEELSDRYERRAHRIVMIGLCAVGATTVVVSAARLVSGASADTVAAGAVLASVSLVVLACLSWSKQRLGTRIPSAALLADSHLSAIGAAQAAMTLLGIVASNWLRWHSADAVAAMGVGLVAVTLAAVSWLRERSVS
jgi:divalent metal cation (Fe/Co/Zn/Cd) transporter